MWLVYSTTEGNIKVDKCIALQSGKWVLWIIPVFLAHKSHDGCALPDFGAISEFQTWDLLVWHRGFDSRPVWELNNVIFEIHFGVRHKHLDGISSSI